jgi:DnaA family protein
MRQLPLEVGRAEDAVFDTFYPGRNATAVHALRDLAVSSAQGLIWLWGPEGCGRSHLLQAAVAAAHSRGEPATCLPLGGLAATATDALEGLGALRLVALDDVAARAGSEAWERALFRCYEELAASGASLVAAGDQPPGHSGFHLPDLASRMAAGAVFRLQRLSDDECVAALQLRARWRGLELPDETARYLLGRVERSTAHLFGLLARLDRAALVAQRRLSIAFVRDVLDAG